ncbi:MAG: CPBP family intramembrane metalloprotease [Eubacterium sp.]|nr:CPBP family intramembrane metalloprotease [Eubacterium sp.]
MPQYYYNPFGNSSDVNEARQREYNRQLKVTQEKQEIRKISLSIGCAIVAYIVIQMLAASLLSAFGLYELYLNNPIFQDGFMIIGVSFASVAVPFGIVALVNKKRYTSPVIPNNRLKASRAFVWVAFGMGCCCVLQIAVSFIVTFFYEVLGLELKSSDITTPDSILACFMNLIAIAVIPAICEEFAMRCCSLQLLKKYGKGFAVTAVSIVFGLLHGNAIQFIFAFSIALVLGYITVRTDSIAPAIFIHMLNNGMSVVQNTVNFVAEGTQASTYSTSIIYLFWIAVGAVAGFYLLIKKELVKKENKSQSVLTTGQKFTAFLFPWMIVPFFILILLTAQTVAKV